MFMSYLGRIVEECKELLGERKDKNIFLHFLKRSANNVSHYLASYNSSVADRRWGMRDVHPELLLAMSRDLMN